MIEAEVRKSEIHGKGLFAKQAVSPGTLIGVYEGRIIVEEMDGPYVLWLVDDEGRHFGIECDTDLRFINSEAAPNAVLGANGPFVFCASPILPGDEITLSYLEEEDD